MAGQVVGHRYGPGLLWDQGRVTVIDARLLPGAQLTVPWGINDAGQIVGYHSTTPYHEHGFMLNPDR
jgi:probable HAF family extracellular repeat protein